MRALSTAVLLIVALAGQSPVVAQAPAERTLQVSFDLQGNVTVIAQNVTIREILAEWGRQGGTTMVNADRLAGTPVSRAYVNRPEGEVIESLLRQAAGYIVAPRRVGTVGASKFETIQITPTSTATSGAYMAPPTSAVSAPLTTPGAPDDEIPPVMPPGVAGGALTAPPTARESAPRPTPTYPGSGVAVPVVPVVPVPSSGSGTTPPATGRGRGGGGR